MSESCIKSVDAPLLTYELFQRQFMPSKTFVNARL
jgi:hypothetical protein